MKLQMVISGIAVATLALCMASPGAQTRKPAPKPAAPPAVKGTAQLPGDNGKLNQAYTMGKEDQLNFTLTGAEYTLGRLVVGDTIYAPTRDQKLLAAKLHRAEPQQNRDNDSVRHVYDRSRGQPGCQSRLARSGGEAGREQGAARHAVEARAEGAGAWRRDRPCRCKYPETDR